MAVNILMNHGGVGRHTYEKLRIYFCFYIQDFLNKLIQIAYVVLLPKKVQTNCGQSQAAALGQKHLRCNQKLREILECHGFVMHTKLNSKVIQSIQAFKSNILT